MLSDKRQEKIPFPYMPAHWNYLQKDQHFLPKRGADRSLWAAQGSVPSAHRPEYLHDRTATIRLPESPLLVQKPRVPFLKQSQTFQTWAKALAPCKLPQ